MPFKTPIGYYREQIEGVLDDGKQYSRNEISDKLPHIPPNIITGTLYRMYKDGLVNKIQAHKGSRKTLYQAATPDSRPQYPVCLPKVDNSELARVYNVAFEKSEYEQQPL